MRRLLIVFISLILTLTGCAKSESIDSFDSATNSSSGASTVENLVTFKSLDDPNLLLYIEDAVYLDTVTNLNSDQYFVESVTAKYISQEYLEETSYNSQSNMYFGYTLAELNDLFVGTKYIFTLGGNKGTVVQEMQTIDDTTGKIIFKNVAVGTGVILVCVTVTVLTSGTAAPAVNMIFASAASNAMQFAANGALFGGVSAGIIRGFQTRDFNEALEAAALTGSEGFKWGAIAGSITGGAMEGFQLYKGTAGGLSMNQVALIQKESQYPVELIARFNTMDQYEICKNAGLTPKIINGKVALVREINLNYVDEVTGKTNLQLMQNGYAPVDSNGIKYQLHHIGQKTDSPLAILTQEEHIGAGNNSIWHILTDGFENPSSQPDWQKIKSDFWKYYAVLAETGAI